MQFFPQASSDNNFDDTSVWHVNVQKISIQYHPSIIFDSNVWKRRREAGSDLIWSRQKRSHMCTLDYCSKSEKILTHITLNHYQMFQFYFPKLMPGQLVYSILIWLYDSYIRIFCYYSFIIINGEHLYQSFIMPLLLSPNPLSPVRSQWECG